MYPRLRTLRESLGLTQEEFGKSLNIAKSTYNNYETGIRDPKSDFWIAVAKKYHVTIDYLMGFSNDPYNALGIAKNVASYSDSGEESLVEMYRELSEEGQEKLLDYADDLVSSGKYKKSCETRVDKEA